MATTASHRVRSPRSGVGRAETSHSQRALAVLARDAALARIGRARLLLLVVAVLLTALLAALASALLPGKSFGAAGKSSARTGTSSATPRVTSRQSVAVAPRMPAPAGPAQLGLQGAGQAPQSLPPPPPVQSSPSPSAPVQSAPAPSGGGAVVSGGS